MTTTPSHTTQIHALQLALKIVCLRFNLTSGNPQAIETHMNQAMLSLMLLRDQDPTLALCMASLDPWTGHPELPTDFDSCDVRAVRRMLADADAEIARLLNPGTTPALASPPSLCPGKKMTFRASRPLPSDQDDD